MQLLAKFFYKISMSDQNAFHKANGGYWLGTSKITVTITLCIWFLFISSGVYEFREHWDKNEVELPLKWFDRILAQFGSLIPLLVWTWRYVLIKTQNNGFGHRILESLLIIIGMAILRLLLYVGHIYADNFGLFWFLGGDDHLMSDHVLLGSSVVASLTLEIWNVVVDYGLINQQINVKKKWQEYVMLYVFCLFCFDCILFVLVCGDAYYTAKYFHKPSHTVVASVLGTFVFLIPTSVWVLSDANTLQFYGD
eukprot:TRINITY_DN5385_c0_g2_i1.p2 TRINITY_DN5385_c0_g2~~TRINITY_DN5385_c0_g2_i1.p2  ORF type:complete len:252 (-),score=25.58 TRINITY_DN5385_c0_g2_i1:223-978(-)